MGFCSVDRIGDQRLGKGKMGFCAVTWNLRDPHDRSCGWDGERSLSMNGQGF